MTIQLSDEQRQALAAYSRWPVQVFDPATKATYVLLPAEEFERLCNGKHNASAAESEQTKPDELQLPSEVPLGIQRSKEAFLRDLPHLLPMQSPKRRWVAYHGEERIGFGPTETELYQQCFERGLRPDEFYVGWIGPQYFITEETDPSCFEFEEIDSKPTSGPRNP